jgi:SRSO17 transposase
MIAPREARPTVKFVDEYCEDYRKMTVILAFEIYKPKQRLKPGDVYRSKPEIAAQMLTG